MREAEATVAVFCLSLFICRWDTSLPYPPTTSTTTSPHSASPLIHTSLLWYIFGYLSSYVPLIGILQELEANWWSWEERQEGCFEGIEIDIGVAYLYNASQTPQNCLCDVFINN